jgi:hypothetical protein
MSSSSGAASSACRSRGAAPSAAWRSAWWTRPPVPAPRTPPPACWPRSPSCTTRAGNCWRSTWSRPAVTRRTWRSCARSPAAPSTTASAARCRRRGTRPIWPSCGRCRSSTGPSTYGRSCSPGRELRELEPALAPGLAGGLHAPDDHQVDNRELVAALLDVVHRRGVELVREKVANLDIENGRAVGVTLDNGQRFVAGATGAGRRGVVGRAAPGAGAARSRGRRCGWRSNRGASPAWCGAAYGDTRSTWCRAATASWSSARPARRPGSTCGPGRRGVPAAARRPGAGAGAQRGRVRRGEHEPAPGFARQRAAAGDPPMWRDSRSPAGTSATASCWHR